MKKLLFLLLNVFLFAEAGAQFSRFVVQFRHKGATTHSLDQPSAFLAQRAIDRRTRYNIALDSTDLPVPLSYVSQISSIPGVTVLNVSRWLNAVAIQITDPDALMAINALPFVASSWSVAARSPVAPYNKTNDPIKPVNTAAKFHDVGSNYFDYGGNSFDEIHLHEGEFLHNTGLHGQGIQIAMLDGGFFNYTSLDAFDSVNVNGQVLSTWDFVERHSSVVEDHPHGMQCFSIIAANLPGQFIGKAPRSQFHLFRTEDTQSEYPIEEFNWACGAERADSIGADLISSSLGYGYRFNDPIPDYPYSDLNGDITLSARAADFAAAKGLLVFNSAGNSGNDYWKMITTPADGDSIVAVAAVSTDGSVGSFSSYGPSADGRIKPDLASVGAGALIQTPGNTIGTGNGTSYACPNLAGLAACLWQGFPEFNNMRIIGALKKAGNKSNSPDNRTGYGIPNMKTAFIDLLTSFASSSASMDGCDAKLTWTSKDIAGMSYEVERKLAADTAYTRIATINAVGGNILSTQSYELRDPLNGLAAGSISYRIRQTIDPGAPSMPTVFIDTATLISHAPCAGTASNIISIVPNPVIGNSSLVVQTEYAIPQMSIVVYDMQGKRVLNWVESKPAGKFLLNLPARGLSNGQYVVQVFDDDKALGEVAFLKL